MLDVAIEASDEEFKVRYRPRVPEAGPDTDPDVALRDPFFAPGRRARRQRAIDELRGARTMHRRRD